MPPSLLALPALLACSYAAFPGPTNTCPSPNARYVLRWVAPSSHPDEHHLFVRDGRMGPERELLLFPRHVEAFWSRSGARLAITNGRTSEESTVLLWSNLAAPPLDLLNELLAQEGQRVARWDTHHLYLEAKGWVSDGQLRLRLWGYGVPPHTLERRYIYTLGSGFSRE
jgi:hypothetical protein